MPNKNKLVAVILAGGVGSRMGTTGAQIPKVYLPIGLEPVINRPVARSLEIKEVERVYILTRKKHPDLPGVDLKKWAETWKSLWYEGETKRIKIEYEEKLDPLPIEGGSTIHGAIVALWQIANELNKESDPPSHVLVMAGDNFLDGNIFPLVQAASRAPESVIIATRTIANRASASNRFGVVEINRTGEDSNPILGYAEKPEEPRSSDVSIGLYIFPLGQLLRIREYLTQVLAASEGGVEQQKLRAGAPGYFLEWLVNGNQAVRAVPFEGGTWVDVGTPASFLAAIVQLTKNLIERPQCARDLDVLESTKDLSDKFYFLCHRARVSRSGQTNVIAMYFQGDDAIATLNRQAADGTHAIHVEQVVEKNKNKNNDFWSALKAGDSGTAEFGNKGIQEPLELESPLLISGGVFLIDRADDPAYQRGKALIPFLMRDFGAPVDAGRLTTAAGRMDKLDLADVCVSEHAEEMIFFGRLGSNSGDAARILICTPPQWRKATRETILSRLANKGNLVPLIDLKQIELERKRGDALTTAPVETSVLAPPQRYNWQVQIYYRDSDKDKWQLRHEYKNFVLIPDQKSATLEFRLVWLSALTFDGGSAPAYDKDSATLGRLLGIVDGDGHARTALIVKAQALVEYIDKMNRQDVGEILFASDDKERPALEAVAVTDGRTGRFTGSGRKLALAPVTTSVAFFAELLKHPLKPSDGG